MTTYWDQYEIEARLTAILADVRYAQPEHHFGRPYLSAYQLAIEFARRHPEAFAGLGYPIGGEGTGQHTSLSQYLARELSRRIHTGEIVNIEGAFLSNQHLEDIKFKHGAEVVRSSLTKTQFDLSMFRLRPEEQP